MIQSIKDLFIYIDNYQITEMSFIYPYLFIVLIITFIILRTLTKKD